MNSCIIFYFSGTGNTEFVARKFQEYLQTKNYDVTLQAIDSVKESPNLTEYGLIGIGFPIYGYNLPINVRRFINNLPKIENKLAFIFLTSGDAFSLGALGISADLLKRKGFSIVLAEGIRMPSNDNILFNAADLKSEKSQHLRQIAPTKVKQIVDAISYGKSKINGNSLFLKSLSWLTGFWLNEIYRPYFHFHKFYVDEKCLPECRICEEFCPVSNIKKVDIQKVVFDRTCILCARCINCRPVQAIQYGRSQKKRRFKDPDYQPPILR